ncbi:Exocyst complex component 5 [Fasciola gigantica]|uniref:Exocyst complex component 5 n=1 Tax=Fasciola gigantica TaxID=46835 RepID=A0A504Z440_FASGI|nr:Exocyst complex component 5 [Fasciola gigantica]
MSSLSSGICSDSAPNYGIALVDRLTKSTLGIPTADTDLQPEKLKENFGVALHELYLLKIKLQEKTSVLEAKCREDERTFRMTMQRLRNDLSVLHDQFNKLDTQVHMVSGKLVILGDQLERESLPRKRIEEARDLILEFYKFLGAGGGTFATAAINSQGDENQVLEAATRIKNLSALCLELPDDERFLAAKQRVTVANLDLETLLLERFRTSCGNGNTDVMKRIADVLLTSKSHSTCAEIVIEETLKSINPRNINFKEVTQRIVAAEKDIMAVFSRPEGVLMQLINSLFSTKFKPYLDGRIEPSSPVDVYLSNLYTEYQNMDNILKELSDELTIITDPLQLSKLFRELFSGFLTDYIQRETEWLSRHLNKHLTQFYESPRHQKRALSTSGLADLKRDLKAKLRIAPGERDMSDYEGSLLSEEVAVNIIEDVRKAAKRCLLLSQPSEFAENGKRIFTHLYHFLMVDHVEYGVTLALQGLQAADVRYLAANLVYFSVVHDASSIFQFFGKTIDESIMPLVSTSPSYAQDVSSKRVAIQVELEAKLQLGLDRCLNLIVGHVQHILSTEQRKTDFRPELSGQGGSIPVGGPPSNTCQRIVNYLTQVTHEARQHLDGQNLKNFLAELGVRVNRALVDHFYGFTFSDTGGFVAMQDVTAYREVAKHLGSPVVDRLFDVLLKLMNLMLIKPENVQQVTQDYLQSGIPRELLQSFIQLRADYKQTKTQLDVTGKPVR